MEQSRSETMKELWKERRTELLTKIKAGKTNGEPAKRRRKAQDRDLPA
jgi:hypothetical protein